PCLLLTTRHPASSTLFPYTTLFRSDDRRVRRDAAQVGQESAVMMMLELNDIGRREIVGHQNCLLFGFRRRQRARPAHQPLEDPLDRKSTRLNSSHVSISYAVFCLKK